MKIALQQTVEETEEYGIPGLADFECWGKANLVEDEDTEICVRIVDEEESARLNHQYRQCPYPTNVLSFPFESPVKMEKSYLGDIVMAAPVIATEALEQGKSIESHWAHIFIHGLLHLLGYAHQDEAEARRMEMKEIEALNMLGFPNPYIAITIPE